MAKRKRKPRQHLLAVVVRKHQWVDDFQYVRQKDKYGYRVCADNWHLRNLTQYFKRTSPYGGVRVVYALRITMKEVPNG